MSDEKKLEELRILLEQELARRQSRNLRYSLRAFARDLQLSPSFLCQILAAKRGFSAKSAERISNTLASYDPNEPLVAENK
jgi:hypothetical protein